MSTMVTRVAVDATTRRRTVLTNLEIDQAIRDEIDRAERRYGDPISAHEGYGVLAEEVHELLVAVRANASESIRSEAIQVAAVATRLAYAMSNPSVLARSGCR